MVDIPADRILPLISDRCDPTGRTHRADTRNDDDEQDLSLRTYRGALHPQSVLTITSVELEAARILLVDDRVARNGAPEEIASHRLRLGQLRSCLRLAHEIGRTQSKVENGKAEDVVTGFLNADGEARGRPVGVAVDKTGALLIADDVGNTVWRVTSAGR